jgi:hypothetical protein
MFGKIAHEASRKISGSAARSKSVTSRLFKENADLCEERRNEISDGLERFVRNHAMRTAPELSLFPRPKKTANSQNELYIPE